MLLSQGGSCLTCPICDCEYVHISNVSVSQNGSFSIVAPDRGLHVENSDDTDPSVSVFFWCENGHQWFLFFCFDHGITSYYIRRLSDIDISEAVELRRS